MSEGANTEWRAKVRMYRQGLGDCFLVTLKTPRNGRYRILIDCGVIQGTPDASGILDQVARDIAKASKGKVDLLIATHEHYDHIAGFALAEDRFKAIAFGQVWMGWTEDPDDPVARSLVEERQQALSALRLGVARLAADGAQAAAEEAEGFLSFFGAGQGVTRKALEIVRAYTDKPKYVRPTDPPVELPGGARLYVLGPPLDLKMLKKSHPSAGQAYGVDAVRLFLDDVAPAMAGQAESPFGATYAIPMEAAMQAPFFREHYLDPAESRRRLDDAWRGALTDLALKLDSDTNNTSVVVALELPDNGDVLLFVADAQMGSWLTWADLEWEADGRKVTGADLLKRTRVYKVGHHGSHNATLKPGGLELMEALAYALLPVDHVMAVKKRWGRMPLAEIVGELDKRTASKVVRIDQPAPKGMSGVLEETPLWYELTV
jgi:hypothetical protein